VDSSLEDIVREASGSLFNNAAQAWNHTFYWHSLSPSGADQGPSKSLEKALKDAFGGKEAFFEKFTKSATDNFGSGWTWLVKDDAGELSILNTSNAETPLASELVPLLVADVWEHAYYIDYRNARPKYLEAFQKIVNWRFASERFDAPDFFSATKEMSKRYAA
jgi:Fe-Mn family superoxide dismutase